MKLKNKLIGYSGILLLTACGPSKKIQTVILQKPVDTVLKNKKTWNVQIIYTEINRDKHNNPSFRDYYFNVDSSKYFYPASTVKLPAALLALQKLHELRNTGITRSTSMITEAAYS